jgi:hypothetical protein
MGVKTMWSRPIVLSLKRDSVSKLLLTREVATFINQLYFHIRQHLNHEDPPFLHTVYKRSAAGISTTPSASAVQQISLGSLTHG